MTEFPNDNTTFEPKPHNMAMVLSEPLYVDPTLYPTFDAEPEPTSDIIPSDQETTVTFIPSVEPRWVLEQCL